MDSLYILFVDTSSNSAPLTDLVTQYQTYVETFKDYIKVFLFLLIFSALISQIFRT